MPIRNRLSEMHADITEWRRDFHMHPEVLYETERTAAVVADKLRAFGCDEVVTGIGRTGVVGLIRGKTYTSGKVVGLRADMDALPIFEATGKDYASTTPGKMHACGHDGHTAMLLGAAQYLAETRNFDGTVAVVFQPAEEGGAGALAMVEDGLIDRFGISEIYGMHNMPDLPAGEFEIRAGAFYAAIDLFEVTLTGKGGHAAMPSACIDTTVAGSAVVMNLQHIVSRNTSPHQPAVLSITSFRTESDAFNVIPETVILRGTIRTFDAAVRENIKARIAEVASMTMQTYGGTAEVKWTENGYPVMANHEVETGHAAEAAKKVSGSCSTDAAATTGGEDFAFMLEACPGAYIHIGNGSSAGLHHPTYDFNDEIIPAGTSFWVELAEERLRA